MKFIEYLFTDICHANFFFKFYLKISQNKCLKTFRRRIHFVVVLRHNKIHRKGISANLFANIKFLFICQNNIRNNFQVTYFLQVTLSYLVYIRCNAIYRVYISLFFKHSTGETTSLLDVPFGRHFWTIHQKKSDKRTEQNRANRTVSCQHYLSGNISIVI